MSPLLTCAISLREKSYLSLTTHDKNTFFLIDCSVFRDRRIYKVETELSDHTIYTLHCIQLPLSPQASNSNK